MSLTRFARLPIRRQFSAMPYLLADKSNLSAKDPNALGREFQPDGKIGGAAQKVGGPFAADGTVGEKFTKDGAIGGKAQEMADEEAAGKSAFDKDGSIGREFQADGKIGKQAEKVGGPFSKDGVVGKQFTDKGAIGGTVQEELGGTKKK